MGNSPQNKWIKNNTCPSTQNNQVRKIYMCIYVFQPFYISNVDKCNPNKWHRWAPSMRIFPKIYDPFYCSVHITQSPCCSSEYFKLMLRTIVEFVLLLSCTSAAGMTQNFGLRSQSSSHQILMQGGIGLCFRFVFLIPTQTTH